MAWDISLKAVNAGMPPSVDEMYSFGQESYIILPFDVETHVQTLNRAVSDMFVDINVKPEIRGQMDAAKLARLLTIIHSLINAFAVKPKKLLLNETDSTENLVELVEGSQEGSSRIPAPATNPSVSFSLEELAKQWIYVQLEVPVVAIDLYYSSSQEDHLIFSLNHLDTDVILRYLDMQVYCQYESLLIEDSMRSLSQRILLRNDLRDVSETQITYLSTSSKKSPLYIDHQTEIRVDFSNININADTITLLHLQPFIHVLLGRSTSHNGETQTEKESTCLESQNTDRESTCLESQNTDNLFGMRISLCFKSLDLRLFRVFSDEFDYSRELDTTYTIVARNLEAIISLKDLMSADVTIERFHVTDVRDESVDYIFKTIFYPLVRNSDGSLYLPELHGEFDSVLLPDVSIKKFYVIL